jgi:hypothetical protein
MTFLQSSQSLLDAFRRRRPAAEAVSGEEGWRGIGFDTPESGSRGTGRIGRQPDDVFRRFRLVRSGGEYLPEELEGRAPAFTSTISSKGLPLESRSDPEVGRRQAAQHPSPFRELRPRAIELEGGRRPVTKNDGVNAHRDGASAGRCTAESLRELLRKQLGFVEEDGGCRESTALELGREGG